MDDVMLTTVDNPFNPFKDFDKWYAFDTRKGYNTLAYIDRLCPRSSEDFGNFEDELYKDTLNAIIRFQPLVYKKVYETS